MHTKILKIPFVRCVALFGALLTTLAQAASSGRAPSVYAFNHTGTATPDAFLAGEQVELTPRTVSVDVTPLPAKPTLTSFTAAPSSVTAGQSTALAWVVNGATSLSISPGIGAVTPATPVIEVTAGDSLTASAPGTLAFDLSATDAVTAP